MEIPSQVPSGRQRGVHRTPGERERDLARLADLYVLGKSHLAIAGEIGIDRAQVSRDIKRLIAEWQKARLVTLDQAKAVELAKIDHLEARSWECFERSLAERESSVTERQAIELVDKAVSTGLRVPAEKLKATIRREQGDGNPAFLQMVAWCINERIEVLGLKAATQVKLGLDEATITWVDLARRELGRA